MIPLKDKSPHWGFPITNFSIIAVNVWVHLVSSTLQPTELAFLRRDYGLVPIGLYRLTQHFIPEHIPLFSSLFTYMFLHGGWVHLLSNMWFLWIFGRNIEWSMGHLRYLVFYILCGTASGYLHIVSNPLSVTPCVGASGAISGIIGAYLVLFPKAKILTLVPIYFFIKIVEIPAFVYILLWLLFQISGAVANLSPFQGTNVAWSAHFGGFFWGVFTVHFFNKKDAHSIRF